MSGGPTSDAALGSSPRKKFAKSIAHWSEKLEDRQLEVEKLEDSLTSMRNTWSNYLVEQEDTTHLVEELRIIFKRLGQETKGFNQILNSVEK